MLVYSKLVRTLIMSPQLLCNFSSAQLPRLPVPALHDTLNKFLRTVQPLVTPEQIRHTESVVKQFVEPINGVGSQLQALLLKRAETEENWLADWWLNTAYLEYRSPLVVFSSPGCVLPYQTFLSQQQQLQFTAQLILAVLDFKSLIDQDLLKPEMMGKEPLDMSQYKKVFGTCRPPKIPRDQFVYHPNSRHIIIMYRNHLFRLEVLAGDGSAYSETQLSSALQLIMQTVTKDASPVGILSSDHRDNWSKAYQLLAKDGTNLETLQAVESALFVVCLDRAAEPPENQTAAGLQAIHGGGASSNGGNRWFDKTLQFIVSEDGRVGLTYEHSPAEGQPIASVVDHIFNYIKGKMSEKVAGDELPATVLTKHLQFNISSEVQDAIRASSANLDNLVNNLDAVALHFKAYGKEFIKSQKLSPDSYIQMAIQFAFYRTVQPLVTLEQIRHTESVVKQFVEPLNGVGSQLQALLLKRAETEENWVRKRACYEAASTRKYKHGRTETIRSCSVESVEFARTMLSSSTTPHQKVLALRKAVSSHKDYTLQALNGYGVDRHLLGLKLIALSKGLPVPALYSDPSYTKSLHMRISTSQVAVKCDGFMIFGPLVDDGYACCYNPRPDDIKLGITSFISCPETSAKKFGDSLIQSLVDMQQLLASTPTAHL